MSRHLHPHPNIPTRFHLQLGKNLLLLGADGEPLYHSLGTINAEFCYLAARPPFCIVDDSLALWDPEGLLIFFGGGI